MAVVTFSTSYSFIIEDLTAPVLREILWLRPWKCRIKFDEPVDTSDDPGGSAFIKVDLGGARIAGNYQGEPVAIIQLAGLEPDEAWIGYWAQVAGSAYPENNQPRPILAVDTTNRTITVSTDSAYGGYLKADDGKDRDSQGLLVRDRTIKVSISPWHFTARLSSEGSAYDAISAERTQCAYCPMPIAAQVATAAEVPADEDYRKYITLTLEDDISFGRLYTLHCQGVKDLYDNATADAQLDFQSPWFGAPSDRLKLWMNGVLPPPDRTDDLQQERLLRKLAVVLQDALNSLWYRADQMQYLWDPSMCPDEWVDFLLYDRANPFRFPLETIEQKRLLAAALPGFYKKVGTAKGIVEMLELLLGITFQIVPFVEADYWILGTSRLGLTTILGPGEAWARNAYEIISPVDLTDAQRRIVWDVATWADPLNMHLVRIVEPSSGTPTIPTYWILGTSALGISTTLSGT